MPPEWVPESRVRTVCRLPPQDGMQSPMCCEESAHHPLGKKKKNLKRLPDSANQNTEHWDFPGGPLVRKPPAYAGTRVRSLVWEDPTCGGATKARVPQLLSLHSRAHWPQLPKPVCPRAHGPQREKPQQ